MTALLETIAGHRVTQLATTANFMITCHPVAMQDGTLYANTSHAIRWATIDPLGRHGLLITDLPNKFVSGDALTNRHGPGRQCQDLPGCEPIPRSQFLTGRQWIPPTNT